MKLRFLTVLTGIVLGGVLLFLVWLFFNPDRVISYHVEVVKSYDYVEEPKEPATFALPPGSIFTYDKPEIYEQQGVLESGYPKAERKIRQTLSIDPTQNLKITVEKGTNFINTLTTGGDYAEGFWAGLGLYIKYTVQQGYVCPIYKNGTTGEQKSFVAKQPIDLWVDIVKSLSYKLDLPLEEAGTPVE